MGRAPCCDKANVKRGPWSPEEDSKLKSYIEEHGTGGNWIALPQKIGLKRCGKSCRLRWLNYLRPNIRHGGFSEEEDDIICNLYTSIGSRWSIIAAQLPGRTDNDIKNYWNTRLKKKLLGKQRKEKQARQASALKQETKREIETSFMVSEPLNQVLYWPQLPVAMSVANLNEETRSKDQALIKNLLVKLGGKFSDHHHHHQLPNNNNFTNFEYPFGTLDQLYDNSIGTFSSSLMPMNSTFSQLPNTQYVINGEEPNMIQGLNNFTIDELESFSRVDMVNASNNSSSAESTSYGDISSLVYPPMASNYEPYQPAGMVQDSEFEESRYFRLQ